MSDNTKATVGLDCGSAVADVSAALSKAVDDQYDFIAVPLFHPRFRRDAVGISEAREGAGTRSDHELPARRWTTAVVGKISPWLKLDDPCERIRNDSVTAFKQELAWSTHLGVPALLLPAPTMRCFNYAHCLNQAIQASSYINAWVQIPLTYPAGYNLDAPEHATALESRERRDPWEAWNTFRCLTESHPALGVCLEITAQLPSEGVIAKWLGEPVRAAIIPTDIFTVNKAGYPTLSAKHQSFVQRLFLHKVQFLVRGRPVGGSMKVYAQYLAHLFDSLPPMTEREAFESPYYDYLQAPLQPLMDNLESQTYETFERDPIKYAQYEKAVMLALADTPVDKRSVVMVVGAGRGPLVRATLKAADTARRSVLVYAVEKNPNAVITLRNLHRSAGWGSRVTVVHHDMRSWKAPELADILVSELLGSFGDNELSPECLDGAQSFLKPDGISIPSEYTSFVAPVTSSKLWNEAKNGKELKSFETPYVVKLFNHKCLSDTQPVFRFVHPNRAERIDNRRYHQMKFESNDNAMIHGLAGYFDAKLYKDVHISIHPPTESPGMFSWFPIYFPIRTPMYVEAGATIEVHMWRNVSATKVWYEWCISSPDLSPIHNPGGRSYWIGL